MNEVQNSGDEQTVKSISVNLFEEGKFTGIFPGWGEPRIILLDYNKSKVVVDTATNLTKEERIPSQAIEKEGKVEAYVERGHKKLNTLFSVSIAGCDLMGSCLYTAGVCAYNSGKVCDIICLQVLFFIL